MQALSIRQPYAELILRGIKKVEYRSRPTKRIGERFYIYASKSSVVSGPWSVAKGKAADSSSSLTSDLRPLTSSPWSNDLSAARPPAWLVELWEQVRMIEAQEHEDWPTGVIVGSAIISKVERIVSSPLSAVSGDGSSHATDNCQLTTDAVYAWHLKDVRRAKRLRKPIGHPQPIWFSPFGRS